MKECRLRSSTWWRITKIGIRVVPHFLFGPQNLLLTIHKSCVQTIFCSSTQDQIKKDYADLKIGDLCPGCGDKVCFPCKSSRLFFCIRKWGHGSKPFHLKFSLRDADGTFMRVGEKRKILWMTPTKSRSDKYLLNEEPGIKARNEKGKLSERLKINPVDSWRQIFSQY